MTSSPPAANVEPDDERGRLRVGPSNGDDLALALTPLRALTADADLTAIAASLRALAELAADLDVLSRETVRELAMRELKRLSVHSPAKMIDAALMAVAENGAAQPVAGRPLLLRDPELWPAVVAGDALLDELSATLQRFVVLPPGAADAIALWIVFTHCIDAFEVAPLLLLTSATKRCGKTRLKEITARLVARPLAVTNITAAALFRAVEEYRPTLLVDEADRFLKENPELNGIVNGAHSRDSAYVVRCVGDDNQPRQFSTWCAKLIAGIGRQLGTLEDRSLIIELRRRAPGEVVEPYRLHRAAMFEPLQQRAARWAADHVAALRSAEPDLPDLNGNDRAVDNWRPLLAIADTCGGLWPERARRAARALAGGASDDGDGVGVMLLSDLRNLFAERGEDVLATATILHSLQALEERPWADYRHGKALSAETLATLLRPFGVHSQRRRLGQAVNAVACYGLADLNDAFSRWLSAGNPAHPEQACKSSVSEAAQSESTTRHNPAHGTEAEELWLFASEAEEVLA